MSMHISKKISDDESNFTELPFEMPGHIYRGKMPWLEELPAWEQKLRDNKVNTVVLLITQQESEFYLELDLGKWYEDRHFNVIYLPIEDYSVPSEHKLTVILDNIEDKAKQGKNIVVHCIGGIGRTGLVCSCLAKKIFHYSGEEAVSWVRKSIAHAVESVEQTKFVNAFGEKKVQKISQSSSSSAAAPVSQHHSSKTSLTELPFNMRGHIYVGKMPLAKDLPLWEKDLKNNKVSTIVLLTPQKESEFCLNVDLHKWYEEHNFNVVYLPIEENSVPTEENLNKALDQIIRQAQAGENTTIHCQSGLGRTGIVSACLARKIFRCNGDEALGWVREVIPRAVDTKDQINFVKNYGKEKK